MKLERLNENQIRCTLTSEDLASRHIRLAELAYGSEKARSLFRDMMTQARTKLGFDAENIPLMIEAIPVSSDSIILVITKVEDPEELDTRFARFAPNPGSDAKNTPPIEDADDILNLIQKLYDAKKQASSPENAEEGPDSTSASSGKSSGSVPSAKPGTRRRTNPGRSTAAKGNVQGTQELDFVRLYRFGTLDEVIAGAAALGSSYEGENTLYRTNGDLPYTLVLHKSELTPDAFNRVCNRLADYGESAPCTGAHEAWLREHGRVIRAGDAVQTLRNL